MFSFHNRIIYGIITLSFLINVALCDIEYHKDLNETCSVNLQCETGCCQEDICVETIKCKEFRNKIYIAAAIVGLALSAICTIYLMYNLRKIKNKFNEDVNKKRSTEGNQVKPKNI